MSGTEYTSSLDSLPVCLNHLTVQFASPIALTTLTDLKCSYCQAISNDDEVQGNNDEDIDDDEGLHEYRES